MNVTSPAVKFVDCSLAAHGAAILEIYNEVIANSTAVYEYLPFDANYIEKWFEGKRAGDYPVIGAVDEVGVLMGFASYGVFRARPAYKYSVEHSVYVHHAHRGKGLGDALLQRIIAAAKNQNYHVMVGGIDAENVASIKLHERHGFVHSGTITQSGFKFGRWLDVAFYQLTLATPVNPVDG
jgi:phosphinothricin acetyltransferase